MSSSSGFAKFVAAIVVSAGIAGAGWLVGKGLSDMRSLDRAVWPITYVATDDVLQNAQAKIESDTTALLAFLETHGITKDMTELQSLQVTDQLAQSYRSGPIESRYIVSQTIQVRTDNVDAVVGATQDIGKLLQGGIVLGGQGYNPGPSFMFTKLNVCPKKVFSPLSWSSGRYSPRNAGIVPNPSGRWCAKQHGKPADQQNRARCHHHGISDRGLITFG